MGEAAPKEPTMEEILASIRRIVAQDEASPSTAARPAQPAASPQPAQPRGAPLATGAARPAQGGGSFAQLAREVTGEKRMAQPAAPRPEARQGVAGDDSQARFRSQAGTRVVPEPRPAAAVDRGVGGAPRPAAPLAAATPASALNPASGAPAQSRPSAPNPGVSPAGERHVAQPAQASSQPAAAAPAQPASQPRSEVPKPVRPAVARESVPPAESRKEVEAFRNALVSPGTETAVDGSLHRLKESVRNDLDARVEAVLRPMLREWLDDNLPKLVERLVRVEIERLVRREE